MIDVLFRNAWGKHVEFNMGEEFEPFSLAEWCRYLLVTAGGVVLVIATVWRERRGSILVTAATASMIIFFLLTLRTNRFLEYLVPFATLALALVAERKGLSRVLPAFAAASLLHSLVAGMPLLRYITSGEQRLWQMESAVIEKFARSIPPGAAVFTCGWEYTGTLMAHLPERSYMVALDPTLMYKRDAGLYDLWYRTLRDAPRESADVVRKQFASRYIVCLDHPTLHPFFSAVSADAGATVLHSDGKWVLFDLGGESKVQR